MNQTERIQNAVLRRMHSRYLYTERQVNAMLKVLRNADIYVKAELVCIGDSKVLKKGLEIRNEQLRGIPKRIDEIVLDLKSDQTLLMRSAINTDFHSGFKRHNSRGPNDLQWTVIEPWNVDILIQLFYSK